MKTTLLTLAIGLVAGFGLGFAVPALSAISASNIVVQTAANTAFMDDDRKPVVVKPKAPQPKVYWYTYDVVRFGEDSQYRTTILTDRKRNVVCYLTIKYGVGDVVQSCVAL